MRYVKLCFLAFLSFILLTSAHPTHPHARWLHNIRHGLQKPLKLPKNPQNGSWIKSSSVVSHVAVQLKKSSRTTPMLYSLFLACTLYIFLTIIIIITLFLFLYYLFYRYFLHAWSYVMLQYITIPSLERTLFFMITLPNALPSAVCVCRAAQLYHAVTSPLLCHTFAWPLTIVRRVIIILKKRWNNIFVSTELIQFVICVLSCIFHDTNLWYCSYCNPICWTIIHR